MRESRTSGSVEGLIPQGVSLLDKLNFINMLAWQTYVTKRVTFSNVVPALKKGAKTHLPQRKTLFPIQLPHLCGCKS